MRRNLLLERGVGWMKGAEELEEKVDVPRGVMREIVDLKCRF
jgi:hypothetical protein